MFTHFNFAIIPILIPIILAGKTFLDTQDFAMAFNDLVRKRTIILTLLALFIAVILQIALNGALF